jgi:hypothetical protein
LSIALLSCLPALVFIVGADRAYGLAGCLLVLSFGAIWRLVESPTRSRIISAGVICLLFVQCVYSDIIFLGAMLVAGALVGLRQHRWEIFWAMAAIGFIGAASLFIYLPIIHRDSEYLALVRSPTFNATNIWDGLRDALGAPSSASPNSANGPQTWIWMGLLLAAIIVAVLLQRTGARRPAEPEDHNRGNRDPSDLALFCVTSMALGIIAYTGFLLRLRFSMESWYYVEILILCAISLDGILTARWPALRPWGLLRITFLAVMITLNAGPAWAEAHTRRSNLDLAAAFLSENASPNDLIVVQDAWEGITFNRYYRGQAQWLSVPPLDSHEVHRNDLVMAKMNQADTMTPVLQSITSTLATGHNVWLLGSIPFERPKDAPPGAAPPPPPPSEMPSGWWYGAYLYWWNQQAIALLRDHAQLGKSEAFSVPGPINHFEDVSVLRFSGFNPGSE